MRMGDKKDSTDDWILKINLKALMEYMRCKDSGFEVKNIYLTDVAMVVHIYCSSISDSTKNCLAKLLRFLSGCAEEVGFVLPMLCVADISKGVDVGGEILSKMKQWAADQDWHRGDFSIIVVSENMDAEDVICKIIGDVATGWPSINLGVQDIKDIIDNFESERKAKQLSADHASLLTAIAEALRNKGDDRSLSVWIDERLKDMRLLMGVDEKDEQ